METEEIQEEIDLFEILNRFFKILKKLWPLVLILAVLGTGFSYFRVRQSFSPYYESKAIFSVSSGYAENDIFTSSYYYDISAASQLASSFPSVLNTDIMRDLIIARLDKSYINGSIIPSNVAQTNLFELTVRSSDPQDAYDILCAVIEAYPQAMVYSLDTPQLIIRQSPTVPEAPVNSFDAAGALTKGLILGLAVGFLIIACQAVLIRTVGSAEELKKAVNLPLLASFPRVVQKKRRTTRHTFLNAEDDQGFSEALRGLRTRIRKQLAQKDGKFVLFTSTLPGEGKSTVCANLALSLAAEGNRVALVDADLRNQSIHRMFSSEKHGAGLMTCLKDPNLDPIKVLHQVENTSLYYLSGTSINSRHYSIDTQAMIRVMDALDREFDYVIMDSPPCSIVSDTALLGRFSESIIYVVKQDHATHSQILDAVTGLYERELPLTGCILTHASRPKNHGYGYSYGYGYGKKYGYQNTKKKT